MYKLTAFTNSDAVGNSIIFNQHHKSLSKYSSFYLHDISFLSLFFFLYLNIIFSSMLQLIFISS